MISVFSKNKKNQFDLIYEKYVKMMYLLTIRYVGSEFNAEEVVQRGFIKAYKGLRKFDNQGEAALKGWLSKIMINEALLFLREQNRFSFQLVIEENTEVQSPQIEQDLDYESCLRYIRQLPDGYRTIFNLYVIEGYSHKEIAGMLNLSESASRSQLSRARNILKEKLKTSISHEKHIG